MTKETNLSLKSLLDNEKLKSDGTNFMDWYRNLRIILRHEKIDYILNAPVSVAPAENANAEDTAQYFKHIDDEHEVSCLLVAMMSSDLQKRFDDHSSFYIMGQIKKMFQEQTRVKRYNITQAFLACKMLREPLFVYEIPDKQLMEKYSSFHGYAPVHLPMCSYNYDKNFPGERSKIQFIPDGQLLVLLDSIRTPWCSKREFGCLCSVCKAASQGSSVKVVSVKAGYMSVLAKLKVVETSHCLLVCEPCYLVAAQKGGRLHVWVMNTTWSMDVEEFTLPYFTDTAIMVELEKMPNWAYLIIGHDCVGRFGLWDVSRRVLLAKFTYSGYSIHHFLPFGFFSCQKNGAIPSIDEDRHQAAVLRTSELSFWGPSGKSAYSPMESEDVAVWLLASAVSCNTYSSNQFLEGSSKSYTGCWRLALLVKDMLILGNTVDTRSSAANVLPGYGIVGRIDGHVYLWQLTSGHKVADLDNLKGARVACIAADASSNTFAVASDDCRVFLYMCS